MDDALRLLLAGESGIRTIADRDAFCEFMRRCEQAPEIVDVAIPEAVANASISLSGVGGVQ